MIAVTQHNHFLLALLGEEDDSNALDSASGGIAFLAQNIGDSLESEPLRYLYRLTHVTVVADHEKPQFFGNVSICHKDIAAQRSTYLPRSPIHICERESFYLQIYSSL